MDEKTKKRILELHEQGMGIYKIAAKLGVSYTSVKYIISPEYREYARQAHKRYFAKLKGISKIQTPPEHSDIIPEDAKWLSQHRQSVERRDKVLINAGAFLGSFTLTLVTILAFAVALAFILNNSFVIGIRFFLVGTVISILSVGISTLSFWDDKDNIVIAGIISGVIFSFLITLFYIIPMASIAQYPVSMQVFYPNHPNLIITQTCTKFSVSSSGYLNGQPITPQNTTECHLPQSMAPDDSNPFNCKIMNKSIICSGTPPGQNVTWKGTILNVSKR